MPLHPTIRQLTILHYLSLWIEEHATAPSFRELATFSGLRSVRTVTEHIHALRRKGLVAHHPGLSRTIFLTPKGREALAAFEPRAALALE